MMTETKTTSVKTEFKTMSSRSIFSRTSFRVTEKDLAAHQVVFLTLNENRLIYKLKSRETFGRGEKNLKTGRRDGEF
jgi:hypothetical protein